ncbi:MAG TPA: hypothetical protein PLP14_08320, partial [Chitinophagaceae bacterium]|nr:hypothetical protein [Chitinophagaceae bacterium]
MKRTLLALALTLGLGNLYAQAPVKTITGNLTGTVNWVRDTIYLLQGKVYVKAGATLNIAPGTIIKGDKSVPGSALIVTRGARIYAIGTATEPIVFTSSEPAGSRATADWGGVILAGNAVVNVSGGIGTLEGGNLANPDGTTSDGQYGGLNNLDNSGELRYVRIEFAGYAYAPNNELNGLTLAAVGSGTKISHVQVSYGFDDSFEFFGGTVNADHLISFRGNDDDFDTDFGFSGKVQFGVAMRDTAVADAVSGANGFESDNDGSGSGNSPFTSAVFSNMTLIGPKFTPTTTINPNFKRGAHIRRNSRESVFNSIWMGWPVGVLIDGDSCHRNADSNWLAMKNNVVAGCTLSLDSTGGASWGVTPWFTASGNSNTVYTLNTDVQLTNPFNYTSPDFRPSSGSPVLTGAAFTDAKLSTGFDNTPTYRGAFGTVNWTQDWASFDPQNNPYLYGYGAS